MATVQDTRIVHQGGEGKLQRLGGKGEAQSVRDAYDAKQGGKK
jgi:hypothetical protein